MACQKREAEQQTRRKAGNEREPRKGERRAGRRDWTAQYIPMTGIAGLFTPEIPSAHTSETVSFRRATTNSSRAVLLINSAPSDAAGAPKRRQVSRQFSLKLETKKGADGGKATVVVVVVVVVDLVSSTQVSVVRLSMMLLHQWQLHIRQVQVLQFAQWFIQSIYVISVHLRLV